MIVGAAIKQKKITSHHQRISEWLPTLKGNDALATWRHVITQSAGFDYPYGYLTWVNTDADYFPDADRRWAWGSGAGGTKVMWNRDNGIVFAAVGVDLLPKLESIPRIIEQSIK